MGQTNPKNCPFPFGICTPNIPHGSLGPPESAPKWHLDRFIGAHKHDQQTYTTNTYMDIQGAPIKNNSLGKILYLHNCSKF